MTKDQDATLTRLVEVFVKAYHDRFAPGARRPLILFPRKRA